MTSPWDIARLLAERTGKPYDLAVESAASLDAEDLRACAVAFLDEEIAEVRRNWARSIEQGHVPKGCLRRISAFDLEEKAGYAYIETAVLRVRELQHSFDSGAIALEAALTEVVALRDGWPNGLRDGRTIAGSRLREMCIEERLVGQVDHEVWSKTIRHGRLEDIEAQRHYARRTLDWQVEEELKLRDLREAAGLPREATWGEDLLAILALRNRSPFEITPDLLASEFVVAGRMVTWGDATVADHLVRVDAQTALAAGTMEDAQRHLEAAEFLEHEHLPCLGALALEDVAA